MAHTELDLVERRGIDDMLNAKMPIREIAEVLGRHPTRIYRAIKRNGFGDEELPYLSGYYGTVDQHEATDRPARRRQVDRLAGFRKTRNQQMQGGGGGGTK